jgi:hypothetical protein
MQSGGQTADGGAPLPAAPRRKKQKRYDYQLNVKVKSDLVLKLQDIADYELSKVSELVRGWINEKVKEYEGNRRYNKWLEIQRRRSEHGK